MYTSLTEERRKYTCPVCGQERTILTKPLEKWILVCVHPDSRGGVLPVLLLREEGQRIID